jgi:hypothetical protein
VLTRESWTSVYWKVRVPYGNPTGTCEQDPIWCLWLLLPPLFLNIDFYVAKCCLYEKKIDVKNCKKKGGAIRGNIGSCPQVPVGNQRGNIGSCPQVPVGNQRGNIGSCPQVPVGDQRQHRALSTSTCGQSERQHRVLSTSTCG